MLKVPAGTFSKSHSAAWITPEGDFIPLVGDQHHAELAAEFPGMPRLNDTMAGDSGLDHEEIINAHNYPSAYAISRMGYVKVSSPFQCAWDGKGRRRDVRMETMASFMAQAIVWLKGSRHNPWDIDPNEDLVELPVYVTTVTHPDIYKRTEREDTTVGDFMDRYGSREAVDFLYGNIIGESFIRTCREVEKRLLRSTALREGRIAAGNDGLYRLIVRELLRISR